MFFSHQSGAFYQILYQSVWKKEPVKSGNHGKDDNVWQHVK